jgi:hypothetical protein
VPVYDTDREKVIDPRDSDTDEDSDAVVDAVSSAVNVGVGTSVSERDTD